MNTTQTPLPPTRSESSRSSWGVLAALIVILAAVVSGALFLFKERTSIAQLETQGTTTDPAAIENDLNAQSPDDFDRELDEAFVEMDAAFEAR